MPETRTLETGTDWAATLYLLPHGTDRETTGRSLAAALLGGGERGKSLASRGVHPDLIELVPPRGKEKIGIDQVREVVRRGQFAPAEAGRKVCLIPRAESLTPEAENALLKVLEEPTQNLVFLLLAEHPADVLPTILSRSRLVRLPPRSREGLLGALSSVGYDEGESRYLLSAARREEEMAEFLGGRRDVTSERAAARDEARAAEVERLAEMARSDAPIVRHEAVLSLLARLVQGEPGLPVLAARLLAPASREEAIRFLEDLLFRTFEVVRALVSPDDPSRDSDLAELAKTVDAGRLLALGEAIDRARLAVEAYTPTEAVLLSLFVRAGGLRRG